MKKNKNVIISLFLTSLFLIPFPIYAFQKSETIYSNLDYDGKPYSTLVTNHLSLKEEANIEDETDLKDILNLNGTETFTLNNRKLLWNPQGNDIFYQGKIDKNLPIQVDIKYYLNEKEKNIKDIIGKEGTIKVVYQLKNTNSHQIKVNGKTEQLYTPFVVALGTMINNEENKNIEITNGKVISTGTKSMVIGIASPGLYDSIGYEDFESLDQIILTFETKNFSLNNIYIVATPKLMEETDFKIFDKMNDLTQNIQTLQTNMNEIEKGAKELENGAKVLEKGTSKIAVNLKQASTSITELKNGSLSLKEGIDQIITSLNQVASQMNQNDLKDSLTQLKYLKNQNQTAINQLVQKTGLSLETLMQTYTQNNLKDYTGSDEKLNLLKSTYEMIVLLKSNNTAIDGTITLITETSEKLNTTIPVLVQSLKKLQQGTTKVSTGLTQLQQGMKELYNGSLTLEKGAQDLAKGTTTLSTGTQTFNQKGIHTLSKYASTLKTYSNKTEALVNLSKEYNGFASNNSQMTTFVSMIKAA